MATSDLKTRPAQDRRRIEALENQVSELMGAVGALATEMLRQGTVLPPRLARFSVFKSLVRQSSASRKPTQLVKVKALRRARNEALTELVQLSEPAKAAPAGLTGALARGEAAKVHWVAAGEVVSARALGDQWGLTPQALGPAANRGEVFAIMVKNQRYYPREFLELERDAVSAVTRALGDLSAAEKLVFWKRPHGALGGKTVAQSLSASQDAARLARATELARTWAHEAHASRDAADPA